MSSHLTDAAELTRQYDVAQHVDPHHHPRQHRDRPTPPHPRRHRIAASLRRVADRLDQ